MWGRNLSVARGPGSGIRAGVRTGFPATASGGLGAGPDGALDFALLFLNGDAELIGLLQVEPELGRGPEIPREAEGCVRGDAAPAPHDLVEARGIDRQSFGKLVNAHVERRENVFL